MFVLAEYLLIKYKLFFFPVLILFIGVWLIQSVYKFTYNSIDISNLVVFPIRRNYLIIKLLTTDFWEYKTILFILYTFSVLLFYPQVIGVLIVVFLMFSITSSFVDFLTKRYFIYRIVSGLFVCLSYIILYIFWQIVFSSHNKQWELLNSLERNIIEHYIVSFGIALICLAVLLAAYILSIKRILLNKLFTDKTVISKNGSLY